MELQLVKIDDIHLGDKLFDEIPSDGMDLSNPYILSTNNKLYVLLGKPIVRTLKKVGIPEVMCYVLSCAPEEAFNLIKAEENNRKTKFEKVLIVQEAVDILSKQTHPGLKEDTKPMGKMNAIQLAAKEVGLSSESIRKMLKAANISKIAADKIVGTKLEQDNPTIMKLALLPKEDHLRVVNGLLSGKTFNDMVKKIEKIDKRGKDWPDKYHKLFTTERREMFMLSNIVSGQKSRVISILAKYKNIPERNQRFAIVPKISLLYREIMAILELALPYGPCPYCLFKGCKECDGDGWATKELLIKAQDEGKEIIKYYFNT